MSEDIFPTETLVPPQDYDEAIEASIARSELHPRMVRRVCIPKYVPIIEDFIGLGMSMQEIAVTRNICYHTVSEAISVYFKKPDFTLILKSKV